MNLAAKNWVVAGLGVTGRASVDFLARSGAQVKCWDTRETLVIPEDFCHEVALGKVEDSYWEGVDILVLSPGISPQLDDIQRALAHGVEVIGDVELYARVNQTPAFGITGSNGKTTVTLLLTHILDAFGFKVMAAGNVGKAVLNTVDEDLDYVVIELSSFQLETTSSLKLKGATILNISDDHLDRHGTILAYSAAKQRIYDNADCAVYWRGQAATYPNVDVVKQLTTGLGNVSNDFGYDDTSRHILFKGVPVLDMRRCQLLGKHNVLNIQAALALATLAGIEPQNAAEAVYSFVGAPHRCTEIGTYRGVRFIDDSKATNVGATVAAIKGLSDSVEGKLILIAGGDAKGADLSLLKPSLDKHVAKLITLGRDANKLSVLSNHAHIVANMHEAVVVAFSHAEPGDVVLLSPACASLDMFENYQHRARVFTDAVLQEAGE